MTTEQQANPNANPTGGTPAANPGGAAPTGTAPQAGTGNPAPNGKTDDLDALLKEFETAGAPEPEAKPANGGAAAGDDKKLTPDRLAKVVDFVETQANRSAKERFDADVKSAVAIAKANDALKHLPDEMVREMLEGSAAVDQRIASAWTRRHENPAHWNKVVEAWATKKAEAFKSLPDPKLSTDREALAAAVRGQGASTQAPDRKPPEELRKMSDQEFRAYKEQLAGG